MSDTPQTPNTETPNVETPTETPIEGGGLPSHQNQEVEFKVDEDFLKENLKDGKLKGRFGSLQEVLDKLKEAEDFRANTIREMKEKEGQQKEQQTEAQKQAELAQIQHQTINELLPQFIENGMELTPEMEAKITETGIDIRDVKLGALELKEAMNQAYSIVGGKDQYDAMIAWGKENMSPAEQKAFDTDLAKGMGKYAIKGLYQEYLADVEKSGGRLQGNPAPKGVKPYASQRELFADKRYIDSPSGRRDTAAQKLYKARLAATSDDVIYGRR